LSIGEDTREFLVSYFSSNNIELDVIRVIFFYQLKGCSCKFQQIKKETCFEFIDTNFLSKLKHYNFIYFRMGDVFLGSRGVIAFLHIINPILQTLQDEKQTGEKLSKELLEKGLSFGGRAKIFENHKNIIVAILKNLVENRLVLLEDQIYSLNNQDARMKVGSEIFSSFISSFRIHSRIELQKLISLIAKSLILTNFDLCYLMKTLNQTDQIELKKILGSRDSNDSQLSLEKVIRNKLTELTGKKDSLTVAAYWQLQATIKESDNQKDFCNARAFIALAIYCKQNQDLLSAADFYEKASDILQKSPMHTKSAKLQLANSFECKGKIASINYNFLEGSNFYKKASAIFRTLKMNKEAMFCEYRTCECSARENAVNEEFITASEIMKHAALLIKPWLEKFYFSAMAYSNIYKAKFAERRDEKKSSAEAYFLAAEFFSKAGFVNSSETMRARGRRSEAFALMQDKKPYDEIANKFLEAASLHATAGDIIIARICEADASKNFGLFEKTKGNLQKAMQHFNDGKEIYRELIYLAENPMVKSQYRQASTWFEAIRCETLAHEQLLHAIPKKESLSDVAKLLAHAGDLFTQVGDFKHAEIDSSSIIIAMAIDAFHKGKVEKANSLMDEAKTRLPSDFVHSFLVAEVKPGWEPLRYALGALNEFTKYAQKIETEKGFSFESRMRDLLRKMFGDYKEIESRVFKPKKDEIGIVFTDDAPIEIDALGTRKRENRIQLLVCEIKNTSKPIPKSEIIKLLKKIEFLQKRYRKIAELETLKKPIVEHKIFISKSGFNSAAKSLCDKQQIVTMEKNEINNMLKKYSFYKIP